MSQTARLLRRKGSIAIAAGSLMPSYPPSADAKSNGR